MTPASNPNRRAPRDRPPLDRETVARAALDLLGREGPEAVSMRRLAAELGVGTMTVYGYVRSKRELLDAAIDVAAADFVPAPRTGQLRADLLAYLDAARAWLARHPALVSLRGHEAIVRPAAFGISEHGMRLLLDAGFPPAEAARAFRLAFTYVFGHALVSPRDPTPDEQQAVRAAVLALPEDAFPAMHAAAAGAGAALGGPEQFRYGAERLVDGLAQRLAELGADPA